MKRLNCRIGLILFFIAQVTFYLHVSADAQNKNMKKHGICHVSKFDSKLAEACWLDVSNSKPERVEDVSRLLQLGANPNVHNKFGVTVLMHEAQWEHTRTVDLLLKYGANPNVRSQTGGTALMYATAAGGGSETVFTSLLRHGANPKYRDDRGLNAQLTAGANDAKGDFPAIGDQNLRKH